MCPGQIHRYTFLSLSLSSTGEPGSRGALIGVVGWLVQALARVPVKKYPEHVACKIMHTISNTSLSLSLFLSQSFARALTLSLSLSEFHAQLAV